MNLQYGRRRLIFFKMICAGCALSCEEAVSRDCQLQSVQVAGDAQLGCFPGKVSSKCLENNRTHDPVRVNMKTWEVNVYVP